MINPRHPLALRISSEKLERIDTRAKRAGLSRTEYMVRSSLGELEETPSTTLERFLELEERLDVLERYMNLGA